VPQWYAKTWGGTSCKADFSALGLSKAVNAEIEAPFIEAARRRSGDDQATRAAIARVQQRRVKSWSYRLYTGPKQMETLHAVDASLEEAIDFGWFGLIARPLLSILKFAYGISLSWPLAIVFLTALIKLVLWPITTKSMRSMYKMQRLKPEMDKIREKLTEEARKRGEEKPDPQELNRQTFALYKRHGVNPLGGCLPMFIQMPVYIALYRTIYSSVELFNQPLFLWIGDLTEKDPHYVLPVMLAAVMFIQQRLMPTTGGDPMQRKMMMYGMPVMFGLMMMSLPSGLTFYILINTVLSSFQTAYLKRTT
jgi:YidC/Oxa1 family membrane protein insertase